MVLISITLFQNALLYIETSSLKHMKYTKIGSSYLGPQWSGKNIWLWVTIGNQYKQKVLNFDCVTTVFF